LITTIKSGSGINPTLLAKLDPKRTFLSSPLVCAAEHGRQDVVRLLIKVDNYDVNAAEERTGVNVIYF
jgi:hypothetical protein